MEQEFIEQVNKESFRFKELEKIKEQLDNTVKKKIVEITEDQKQRIIKEKLKYAAIVEKLKEIKALILQEYEKFVTNLKQLKGLNSEILTKRFKEIKEV